MPVSAESLSRLLDYLYEAAACPERWVAFLEEMKSTGSANKVAFILNSDAGCDLSLQVGFDEGAARSYEAYFAQRDLLVQGFLEQMGQRGSWVGTDCSVVAENDLKQSELYSDFMVPNAIEHQCGVALSGLGAGGLFGGLTLLRSDSQGDFGGDTVSLLAVLAPHLRRAWDLHRRISNIRAENADLRQGVQSAGVAMVSVDGAGCVIRINARARMLLETRDGLEVVGGRLSAANALEQKALNDLIQAASATGAGRGFVQPIRVGRRNSPQAAARLYSAPSGGGMLVSRRAPKRALQVVVSPFRSTEILLEERPCALVFLTDPDAAPATRRALLRSMYGLSPMEGRVVELLAGGMDVRETAERLSIGEGTVRFYLKSVFRKTGTRRQSELVGIVLQLPGLEQA